MKLGPTHLKRYKDVAILFMKHGNAELANRGGFAESPEVAGTEVKKTPRTSLTTWRNSGRPL